MSEVLSVEGLSRRYDDLLAVDEVSFSIRHGESYGLLGPNGAGKTTTISIICGLLRPDAGQVVIDGQKLNGAVAPKALIGYVPQEIALYKDLTGRENLRFWGKLYGLSGKDLERRIDELLETVGLADRQRDRVSDYSGGMARRLNIAAGLLHSPKLLVLDEPTVGVDPQSRNAILENVESLKHQGTSILYTTHYMEEAERLCDRVGIIDSGRLIAEGTRRELVAQIEQRDRIEIAIEGDTQAAFRSLSAIPEVEEVSLHETGVSLLCPQGRKALPRLIEAVSSSGGSVGSIEVFEPDLEAVFLHLTGKGLRD